jgi:hypothetical protein
VTDSTILGDSIAKYSRWSENDELGPMNLVGPEKVRAAATLVRDDKVISP